jgi:phenylalanyl-tRNA synthetase beta chain
MKISLEWLRDFLPTATDPHRLGDALTNGGLPVELFEKHGDDDVIDVEVTSNRSDCLSHQGVSRELSALLDQPMRLSASKPGESATRTDSATKVQIDALYLCPHYTARIIRNVKIGPSPAWMMRRLEAVGLRSINNVVDVTNYVMFEMGQPLHAFDFDKLKDHRIVVRRGAAGEKLMSLDGHAHVLDSSMLVIADAVQPVALAGIMGGQATEVTDRTVNILLESARFDPLVIRKTARALSMKSDSSYRFERGIDPTLPAAASLRAAELILQTAGGELLAGLVEAGATGYTPKKLTLRLSQLKRVLGIDVSPADAVASLRRLQFSPTSVGDNIEITVPHWRLDINQEIDLVEEVIRVLGYDRLTTRPEISIRLQPIDLQAKAVQKLRDTLISAGYFEAVTFSFVSDLLADDFKPVDATALPRAHPAVRKADGRLRPSILPGLLEAIQRNEYQGNEQVKLFEIGAAFWTDKAGAIQERRRVGLIGGMDLREIRGVVEEILTRLDSTKPVKIVPADGPGFAPGTTAQINWDGRFIGYLGLINPSTTAKLSIKTPPPAAELDVDELLRGFSPLPTLQPLAKFPGVHRDLSLIVSESVRYEQLDALIHRVRPEHLEESQYVTTYRGKPMEKGQKSVTIKLIFRSPQRTLTGNEVESAVKVITDAAGQELHATLRI